MNGWTRSASTLLLPHPAKDHWLFASAPITQCPGVVSTTRDGPASHLPLPNSDSVAVGNVIVGPTPQSSLPEFAGERNTLGLMSPQAECARYPGSGRGLVYDGHNGPCDKVPVLVQSDRNHGLNIQDPLRGVVGTDTEIEVILERDADEVSDGVLGFLSQFLGAFRLWVSGCVSRVAGVHCNAY